MTLDQIAYIPQLKWKAGERAAIKNFSPDWRSRVLPLFRLMPPGDFDAEFKIKLSEDKFLKSFGAQLVEMNGRSPILLDGELLEEFLEPELGRSGFGELLERARLAGADPIPVVSPTSGELYGKSVERYLNWSGLDRLCLRLSPTDLESITGPSELSSIITGFGGLVRSSILLIDAGPVSIDDEESYAHLLAFQFSRLIRENDWGLVSFSSTTFPENPKIAPWSSKSFDRLDWKLYRKIVEHADEFSVVPVFSDYALEYPGGYKPFPKGIAPSAHLRYSTENKYFIFKGKSVRTGEKYKKIFRVADSLVKSGIFKGNEFSSGDAFIEELARGAGRTGSASTWRWCSTDHHLTLALSQLNSLLDLGLSEVKPQVEPDQLQLILP